MSSDPVAADVPSALPRGTRLGELEIRRVLGVGGFGIVYLAFDHGLEREVAVKEYMPQALAGRTATLHVSLRSGSDPDTFSLGLRSFVNEARLLARFDHPSLLKVHRFWEANGTAYMAMPVYRGPTLKQVRQAMDQPPTEAWLRGLVEPLLGALDVLHEAGVFHRDIAPDNIVLEADGRPVLLDFGAARRVIGDATHTLTAILKPAYAPIEQYAEGTQVRQGPWTDLYGLGATLHFLLLGRPPAPATARAVHDDQLPLAGQALGDCSPAFLAVIDWMLAPRPADRPPHVAALREVLAGRALPPPAPVVTTVPAPEPAPVDPAYAPTMVVPRPAPPTPAPAPSPAPSSAATLPSRAPGRALAAGGLLVVVAAVAAWVWWPAGPRAAAVPADAASAAGAASEAAPPLAAAASGPARLPPLPDETRAEAGLPVEPPAATPVRPAPPPRTAAASSAPLTVSGPEQPPAPAPDRRPAPAPPPAPAPALPEPSPPAAAVAPASPSQQCAGRLLLALSRCMERECGRADLRQHPDCVKWRADLDRLAHPQQ